MVKVFDEIRKPPSNNVQIVREVYLDRIALKHSPGGRIKNMSVLAANGFNHDGFRRILSAVEGHKEVASGWLGFLKHLKDRG